MGNTLKNLGHYFLIGVVTVLPLIIIIQVVIYTERLLRDLFTSIYTYSESYWLTVILFALTIGFFSYVGYRVKHRKIRLIDFVEAGIERIPLVGGLYRMVKKLVGFFAGTDHTKLQEVVYVEYPLPGVWAPAFVTNRFEDQFVLYVPTSPNPTSGYTVIVHRSRVRLSGMSIQEASSFILTLGVEYPKLPESVKLQ